MRIGVDEAGKGPVLGPMIAAAVGVPDPDILPEGVADSKRLTPERREELDARIRGDDRISVGVAAVDVERIDDPETDMNSLTVAGQAEATRSLLESGRADADVASDGGSAECAVLADAGDTSESRFARRLADAIEAGGGPAAREDAVEHGSTGPPSTTSLEDAGSPTVEARHGADDEFPVVAAASIVAKVERDARVAELADDYAEEYGDVGSGYPSDPTTREFLEAFVREEGELPGCARRSWQTCDDVLSADEQSGLGEF